MTDKQPPPPRRGFWARTWTRFQDWLHGAPEPPFGSSERPKVRERRTSTSPVVVPAEGGSFSFAVHSEMIYTSTVLTEAKLTARVNELYESDLANLMHVVWPIGRRHVPHRPEHAEEEMNHVLRSKRDEWCHDDIQCTVTVRVLADERVLARQLPHWEMLIDQERNLDRELRRVAHVHELMTEWVRLLERFGDTPVAMQAAGLADAAVGSAVVGLAARRRETEKDLVDVLREARESHAFVGLYELADSYDAAVRRFENRVGTRGSVLDRPVFDIHPRDPEPDRDER